MTEQPVTAIDWRLGWHDGTRVLAASTAFATLLAWWGRCQGQRLEPDGRKTAFVDDDAFGTEKPLTSVAFNEGRIYVAHVPAGFEGATVIHPGAASAARRWPADRFAAVARAEAEAGRRVVVTGGPSEVALAHAVAAGGRHPNVTVRAGGTDVLDFTALVAVAGRVVCGDTGVAHLATGLGRPSVVLFGPVSPTLWGPPRRRPQHVALWAGRRGDPHGRHVDPGLLEIGVPDVLRALRRLDRT